MIHSLEYSNPTLTLKTSTFLESFSHHQSHKKLFKTFTNRTKAKNVLTLLTNRATYFDANKTSYLSTQTVMSFPHVPFCAKQIAKGESMNY
jgi:hypothetical protein